MKILAALSFAFFTTLIAHSQQRNLSSVTGSTLITKCQATIHMDDVKPTLSDQEWSAGFYCLGFVQGAMDADSIWGIAEAKAYGPKAQKLLSYCVPKDVTWPQIVRVLVKWLSDHPDKLNWAGYGVIQMSMSASYPCPATP